eukprot:202035_1
MQQPNVIYVQPQHPQGAQPVNVIYLQQQTIPQQYSLYAAAPQHPAQIIQPQQPHVIQPAVSAPFPHSVSPSAPLENTTKDEPGATPSTTKQLKRKFKYMQLYIGVFLRVFGFVSDVLVLRHVIERSENLTSYCRSTYDVNSQWDDYTCHGADACNADQYCQAPLKPDYISDGYCEDECECCVKHWYHVIVILWSVLFGIICVKEFYRMIYGCCIGLSSRDHFGKGGIDSPATWMQHLNNSMWLVLVMIWNGREWNKYVEFEVSGKLTPGRCNLFMDLFMENIPKTILIIVDTIQMDEMYWTNVLSFGFSIAMILYAITWKVRKANETAYRENNPYAQPFLN